MATAGSIIRKKSFPVAALLSGTLGAVASCLGKFAMDTDAFPKDTMGYLSRAICFLLMLGCNAGMLGSFLSGMEESGSVAGTSLSTAANFSVSAFLGYLLWGEQFNVSWWLGFGMVILGVFILSTKKDLKKEIIKQD
jgi:drug/metabolite transporter (DMT)-like permease